MQLIDYITVFGYLFIILLLFYIVAKLLKNNLDSIRKSKHIEIVDSCAVSTKGQLQIAKIGNKTYLLGVTEQNIQILDEINEELPVINNQGQVVDFSDVFSRVLKRGEKNEK